MTQDELQQLDETGREMDALIFAKVFGGMVFRVPENDKWIFTDEREYLEAGDAYYLGENQIAIRLPCYSTDISAAWQVAEKMGLGMLNNVHRQWEAYIGNVRGVAKSAPLAICRAALLAVMDK